MIFMGEFPIEIEPGKLGCPRCKTPLVDGETPCYYKGRSMGLFDGLVCKTCDYGLLSQKGFDDSGKVIEMWNSGKVIRQPGSPANR